MFCSSFETSQRSYARSSMVMASVSTFQDHNATPAARVAARRCFSCQTGMDISLDDIALYLIYLRPSASSSALAQADSCEIEVSSGTPAKTISVACVLRCEWRGQ